MINKKNLKNKYVTYTDKDSKLRTERVTKITGNTLTVVNAVKVKHRIKKDHVLGRQFRKKGLEDIQW